MIYARKSPFDQDYVRCVAPILSIRELLGNDSDAYLVVVDGEAVEDWENTYPNEDSIVWITPLPQDDVGGFLRVIAAIALFAAAGPLGTSIAAILPGTAAIWSGVVYGVGALAINALFPPPTPKLGTGEERRELKAISGSRNRFPFYEPIPEIAGKHRVFPPYAAKPYTEIVGDDQYFNALFCVGLGEYTLTDSRIGETFLSVYDGVTLEQTTNPDWFDISEESFDIGLIDPADPGSGLTSSIRTTDSDVEEISVDFICPAGLIYTRPNGNRRAVDIDFRVEYREVGETTWLNAVDAVVDGDGWLESTFGNNTVIGVPGAALPDHVGPVRISPANSNDFRVRDKTANAVRFGVKWKVPEGRYEVQVTRTRLAQNNTSLASEPVADRAEIIQRYLQIFKWTVLRSHNTDTQAVQIPAGTATFLKLRIKANDQLNGIIERFNVVAERSLRTWDTPTQSFTTPAATRNPAWYALNVLTGPGNAKAITDPATKIFLDDFATWAAANDTNERYYDRIIESQTSLMEELIRVCSVGGATPILKDGRHTIVRESDGDVARGFITPRNSRNFRSTRVFIEQPHALRVRFISADADYEEDEIIVYDDGFDETNATVFETLRLQGITGANQAWSMGRRQIAQIRLRPERHSAEMDFQHLTFTRGDRLIQQTDVLLQNLGSGRITEKSGNIIKIDDRIAIDPGTSISVQIQRIESGEVLIHTTTATYVPGPEVQQFTLAVDDAFASVGDLVIVGVTGQTDVPMKVLGIEPRQNLSALVHFVDAADAIQTADTGPIPPYNPNITLPRRPEELVPPVPVITDIKSDGNLQTIQASGDRTTRLIISFTVGTFQGLGIQWIEGRIRKKPDTGDDAAWVLLPPVGITSGSISSTEVEFAETYEIQIRSVSFYNVPSAWTAVSEHQVGASIIAPPAVDGFTLTAQRGAINVQTDLTNVEIIDAAKIETKFGTVNDRDDVGTEDRVLLVPQKLENETLASLTYRFADTTTRYFWQRLVDKYGNAGPWLPESATAGQSAAPLVAVVDTPVSDEPTDDSVTFVAATQPQVENAGINANAAYTAPSGGAVRALASWSGRVQISNTTSGTAVGESFIRARVTVNGSQVFTDRVSIEGYLDSQNQWGFFSGSRSFDVPAGQQIVVYLETIRDFSTSGASPAQTHTWEGARTEVVPVVNG